MSEGQFVQKYHGVALKFAGQLATRCAGLLDYDDLLAIGELALVRAYRSWDPAKSKAITWCYIHVRGAMLRAIRTAKGYPAYLQEFENAARTAHPEWWKDENAADVAAALGMTVEAFREKRDRIPAPPVSLEAIAAGYDNTPVLDLPDPSMPLDEQAARNSVSRIVRAIVLEALGERDARVLALTYETDPPRTLQEVGEMVGLCKERVRQIRNTAAEVLRERLQGSEVLQLVGVSPAPMA